MSGDNSESLNVAKQDVSSSHNRKLTELELIRFLGFKDLRMKFGPGINAIIGENSTGKTNILKALYATTNYIDSPMPLAPGLRKVYMPAEDALKELIHKREKQEDDYSKIIVKSDSVSYIITISKLDKRDLYREILPPEWFELEGRAIYIQSKNILDNMPGFGSAVEMEYVAFDSTYSDLIRKTLSTGQVPLSDEYNEILGKIESIIQGHVEIEDETAYLVQDNLRLEMSLVSEGWRKFAMLWKLIVNGSIDSDSIIMWDEPEANLNPRLVREIIYIMLMLQLMGVQIIFATHDYTLLSWLDLLSTEEHDIKYHALYRDGVGDIKCESSSKLSEIKQNAILDVYKELYDEELKRARDRLGNG